MVHEWQIFTSPDHPVPLLVPWAILQPAPHHTVFGCAAQARPRSPSTAPCPPGSWQVPLPQLWGAALACAPWVGSGPGTTTVGKQARAPPPGREPLGSCQWPPTPLHPLPTTTTVDQMIAQVCSENLTFAFENGIRSGGLRSQGWRCLHNHPSSFTWLVRI